MPAEQLHAVFLHCLAYAYYALPALGPFLNVNLKHKIIGVAKGVQWVHVHPPDAYYAFKFYF